MKIIKIIKRAILIISLFAFAVSVSAESPLWKVSKGDDYLFIGGTIHMLSKNDYPLPAEFETIYNQSEYLVFETDLEKLEQLEIQKKMLQKMSYQDGSTLKDHLNPDTYEALVHFLDKSSIPIETIKGFKPGMASLILTMHELEKLGIDTEGVDSFYHNKAKEDSKLLGKLETVDQQLTFLVALGENNPDEFMAYTLRDLKQLPQLFNELRVAWKIGDIQTLNDIGIVPMKKDFPDAYQNLIVQRNNAWIPQIERMIKTKEIEMILVGILHLAGEDSVLKKLKDLGYTVEQY